VPRPRRVSLLAWGLLVLASASPLAAQARGWRRVEVPATGSYFFRYVPFGLDRSAPAPVVLFLHGAGGTPQHYTGALQLAAERAGAVVALPKSTGSVGWGAAADEQTVEETLRLLSQEVQVDFRRVSIAGHSAGGAYAYLLTYPRPSPYSAVFTLASSYYPVESLSGSAYRPPIRMYYGTLDPNFTGGAHASLRAQWQRLGVQYEEDLQPGHGHDTWPGGSMVDGFRFLTAQIHPEASGGLCVPGPTALCLLGGRLRAEVAWHDFSGGEGAGRVVAGAAGASGLFWFFSPDNWELMVKAVDGCDLNGRLWVFSAATTTVAYELTVTDTSTGDAVHYSNRSGQPAPATTDTDAFPCR
jgi:predicted esterase